jgi:Short C-terminal domain/Bacterial PH domain
VARKKDDPVWSLRPDIAAAAARLGSRLRDPKELAPVAAYLGVGETVRFVALATYQRNAGVAVLTDQRLLFSLRGSTEPMLDLPLGRISAVETSAGLATGEVDLTVDQDVVALTRVVKGDVPSLAHAIRQAVEAMPEVPDEPAELSIVQVDPFVAMEKLSALRDSGVITEAEFTAKKRELLDRL